MVWTLVVVVTATLISIVVGSITSRRDEVSGGVTPKSKGRRNGLVAFFVVLPALILIQAYAMNATNRTADGPPANESHSASQANVEPGPSTENTPTPASPTQSSTSESAPAMATSLLDLPLVEQDSNHSIDLENLDTTSIDGTTYGRALAYSCSLFCNGRSPQVFEVVLGKNFKIFSATAAVLDTSSGTYRIDISLDQKPPAKFVTSPGKPTPIRIDVGGISRMRIQIYAPGPLKSPVQAGVDTTGGENGGGLPGIGLADPVLQP